MAATGGHCRSWPRRFPMECCGGHDCAEVEHATYDRVPDVDGKLAHPCGDNGPRCRGARGWVSVLPDASAHVRQNHACALATHQAKFAPSQLLPRFACEVLASLLPKWQCCACVVLYFPAAILPLCC